MNIKKLGNDLKEGIKNKVGKTVVAPLNDLLDQNINDIATTIGSFIVRSVRGKFQRSITFTIGYNYADKWMEEALYGILYKYNSIKKSSRLELSNKPGMNDGTGMYYMLDDGTHNLKYRDYDILLAIQTNSPQSMSGRVMQQRIYTIITYDLSPEFVTQFEKDMIAHRNSLLKIKSDSPTVSVYQDLHESDGYTYWEKTLNINKRRIGTIYLPLESKEKIVNTVNEFFGSKDYYKRHGIAHNLKILLYGPPGPQPVSIDIPTPDGMKRFGDIKPGDYVFNLDKEPTLVEEVYEYKDLDVYEVQFSNGHKVKCAVEHKWPIMNNNGSFTEMSVEELILAKWLYDKDGNPKFKLVQRKNSNNPLYITKIKDLGYKEDMHCLHVADDRHIYLTTGFIPTMNTGKDSIAKMIASEWNRNIYYITGGKDGKFIPNAIVSSDNEVNYPLFLISDIDKYPYLINEPDMDISEGEGSKEEKIRHKQMFGSMINALDGVLSGEGRIIIMTTNHIEKFSETFLRPGRIDLALEVGYVTPEVFRKYTYDFYNVELSEDIKLREKNITIAKLQFDVVFLKLTADEFIKKYVK